MHPEDLPAVQRAFVAALQNPELKPTVQFRYRRRDGSWSWLETAGQNRLEEPEIARVVLNTRDIGERKRLESELSQFQKMEADDDAVRMVTHRVLERFKYMVYDATTGWEALEVWGKHASEINLVLTDVILPDGMTGWELAERLHAQRPTLRVICVTGYSAEVMGKAPGHGSGSRFLQKPCPYNVLVQTIRQSLDEK